MQGGPLVHAIAAKATCFRIAAAEPFRDYQRQVRANADALAEELQARRARRPHRRDRHAPAPGRPAPTEWTGKDAEERLHEVKLTVNRNTVPFDERPPTVASGIRVGTPAATMRGFDEDDFREVGRIMAGALADGDARRARRRAPRRCARSGRSTRASAATRATSHERPSTRAG